MATTYLRVPKVLRDHQAMDVFIQQALSSAIILPSLEQFGIHCDNGYLLDGTTLFFGTTENV